MAMMPPVEVPTIKSKYRPMGSPPRLNSRAASKAAGKVPTIPPTVDRQNSPDRGRSFDAVRRGLNELIHGLFAQAFRRLSGAAGVRGRGRGSELPT
jgi:hypothetical protein